MHFIAKPAKCEASLNVSTICLGGGPSSCPRLAASKGCGDANRRHAAIRNRRIDCLNRFIGRVSPKERDEGMTEMGEGATRRRGGAERRDAVTPSLDERDCRRCFVQGASLLRVAPSPLRPFSSPLTCPHSLSSPEADARSQQAPRTITTR